MNKTNEYFESIMAGLREAIQLANEDKIPGGLADNMSEKDFDPEQLTKGIKVEMEHTSDKEIAKEIAMDHLAEDPLYYDKLEKIEKH